MTSQTLHPYFYTAYDVIPLLNLLATGRQKALSLDVAIPHLRHYRSLWKMTQHRHFHAVTSVLT